MVINEKKVPDWDLDGKRPKEPNGKKIATLKLFVFGVCSHGSGHYGESGLEAEDYSASHSRLVTIAE